MTSRHFTRPLSRVWQGLGTAMRGWTARGELSRLDDRMLKDLGISRAQADFLGRQRAPWHTGPHHDA